MKARAAVAWAPKKPLEIEEVEVMGPKEGEVLLKVIASGVCHTDAFTLSGDDPEGSFIAKANYYENKFESTLQTLYLAIDKNNDGVTNEAEKATSTTMRVLSR